MPSRIDRWHLSHERTELFGELTFINIVASGQYLRRLDVAGSDLFLPFFDVLFPGSGFVGGVTEFLKRFVDRIFVDELLRLVRVVPQQ